MALKDRIFFALIYPGLVLHVGSVLLSLIEFIRLGSITAALVTNAWILGPIYVTALGGWIAHRQLRGSLTWDRFLMSIPWIGAAKKKIALMNFTRTLGGLLEAGVSVAKALEDAGEASGSPMIRREAVRGAELVEGGRSLADAFVASLLFPAIVLQMIDVGEKSGHLPATLLKTSNILEDEANHSMEILMRVLPVAVFLIVAGFFAVKIIAFWTGIYGG